MVLLSEAYGWRLRRLIFGVTKKNFSRTISEILILFETFKYSAQLEALGFLFEEFLRLETSNITTASSSSSSSFSSRFVGSGGGGMGAAAAYGLREGPCLFSRSFIMNGRGGGDAVVLGPQSCRIALLQAVVVELLRDANPGSCVRWNGAVLIIRALEEICVKSYRRSSSPPVFTGGVGGGVSSSSLTSSLVSSMSSVSGSSTHHSTSIGRGGNYWLPSVTFIMAKSSSSSSLSRRGSENSHQLLVPQFLSSPFFLGGSGEREDSGRGGGAGEGVVGEALIRLGIMCRLTVEQQLMLTLALFESGMWRSTREDATLVLRQQLDEYVNLLNAEEEEEGERRDEEVVGDCDEDVEEEVEEIKDYEVKETTNILREGKRVRGRRMRREVRSKDQFRRWSVGDFGTMTSGGCNGGSVGGGGSQLKCNRIKIDRKTSVDKSKKIFSFLSSEIEGGGREEERNHRRVRRFLLPLSVLYRVFEFLCWCCDGGGYKEEMPPQRGASNESSQSSFSSSSSSSSDCYDDEYANVYPHLEGLRRIAIIMWRYHRCYHEATGVMNELLLSLIFECLKNKLRVGEEVGGLILSGCCRRKKERVEVKNKMGEDKVEGDLSGDAVGDAKENEVYIHSLESNNEDKECRHTDEREVEKSIAMDREEMKNLTQTEEEGNENESQHWRSSKFSSFSETKCERKWSDEEVGSDGCSSSSEEESRRAFGLYDEDMSEEEEDENIKMMMRRMRRRGGKRDHKEVLEILGGSRGMEKLPVWEDERRRCLWLEGEDIRQRNEGGGRMRKLNVDKEHENLSSSTLSVASGDIDDNVEVEEKGKDGGGEILKCQEILKCCDWGIRPEEILVDLMVLDDEENIRIKTTTSSPPCASSPSPPSFSFSSSFSSFSNNFSSISSSSDHPIPINGGVLTAAVLSLFGRLGEVQVAEIIISLLRAQMLMMAESDEDRESVVKEKWNITKTLMTTDIGKKGVQSDYQSTLERVEGEVGVPINYRKEEEEIISSLINNNNFLKSQRKKIMTTEAEGGGMIMNAEGEDKSNRTMTRQFMLVSSPSSVIRNTAKGMVSVDGSSGGGGVGVRGRRSSSGGGVGGGGSEHNVGEGGGDGDERLGVGGRLTLVSMSSLFISVVWHQWERWRRRRSEGLGEAEVVVPFTDLICFGNHVWWGQEIMNGNSGGGGGGGGGKDEGMRRSADEDNDGLGEFVDVLRRQSGDVKWSRVFKVMPYVRRCEYPLLKGEGCREVENLEEGRRRGWRGDVKVVSFMMSLLQLRYGGVPGMMSGGMSNRRLEEEREGKEKEVEEEENDGWMGEVKWKEKGSRTDKSSSSINVTCTLMKLMSKTSSGEFQDILEVVSMLVVISDYQWKNGKTQLPLLLMAITMIMPTKSFYKSNVDVFYEGNGAVEGLGRGEGRRSSVGIAKIGCSGDSSGGDSCRFKGRSSVSVSEECSSDDMINNSVLSSSSWLLDWKSSRTTSIIEDEIIDRLILFSSSVIWLEEEMRKKKLEWRERWGVGEAEGVLSELRFQGIYQLIKEVVVCFSNSVVVEKWVSNFLSCFGSDRICGSSSRDGFGRRCRVNWEEVVVEENRETEVEKRNRWWWYLRGWICFVLIVNISQFESMLQMSTSDFGWEMEKIFCYHHPFDLLASSSSSSSFSKEGEWEYDEEEDGGVDSGDGVGGDEIGGVDDTRKGEKAWALILREFADVCLMVAFCLMWAEMSRCDDNKKEEMFVDVIRNEKRNEGKEEIVKDGKGNKLLLWLQHDCYHPFLYDCLLHMGLKGALEKPQAVFFPAMIRTLFDLTPKILLWLVMREGQKSLKWVREVVMALKPSELKTQPQREVEMLKRNTSKEENRLSSRKYLKKLRKQMMADEEKKAKEKGEEEEPKKILISVDERTRGERLLQWLFCDVEGVDTEWHIFVLLELVCVIADVCFNTTTTTTTTSTSSSSSFFLSSTSYAFLQKWLEDSRVRWRNLPSFSLAVAAFLYFKQSFSEGEKEGEGMRKEKNVRVHDFWNLKRTSSSTELISFILSFSSTSSSEERGICLNDEWRTLLLMSLEKPQPPISLDLTPQLNEQLEGRVGNCWNKGQEKSSKTCLGTFSASLPNDVIGVGSSALSSSSLTVPSSHFISSPTCSEFVSSISGVEAFSSSSVSSSSSPIVFSSSLQVRTSGMQSSKSHLPGGLLSGGEAAGGLEGGGRRFSTSSSISGSSLSGSSARNLGTSSIGFCDFSSNSGVTSSVSGGLLSSSLIGGGGEATSKVVKGETDNSSGSSGGGVSAVVAVSVGDTSNSRSSSRNGGGALSSSTSNNISSIMTSSMLRSFSSSAAGASGDGEGGDSSSSSSISSSSASSTSSSFSSAMVASSSSHCQSVGLSPPLSSSSVSTPSSSSSSSSSSFTVSSSRSFSDNIAALTSAVAAISLHSYSTTAVSAARSVGSPTPVSTSSTTTPPNSSVGICSSSSGGVVASRGGVGGVTTAVVSSSSSAMESSVISAANVAAFTGGNKTPLLLQGNIDNNKIEGSEAGGATATASTVVTEAPVGVSANATMITTTTTTATSSGVANAGVSGKIEEGGSGSTRSGNGGAAVTGGRMHHEELEAEVNKYFSKLYTGEMPVSKMLELMQRLSQHPHGSKELNIFNSMLITLFNECRFFPKYPPPELAITAELFGKMIQLDLLTAQGNSLMLALRCVVEALRKGVVSKMFNFGIIALEQFLEKFPSCPQFLEALVQIPDLRQHYPEYNIYAERILKALPERFQQEPYLDSSVIQSLQLPLPPVRKTCGGVSSQSSSLGMSTVTSAAGVMLNATTTGIFSSVMSSSSSTSNAVSGVGAAALLSGPRGFASLSLAPQQSSTPLGPLASSTSSSSQHPVCSGGVSGGVGVGGSTTSQATPIQRNLPMQLTPEQLQGFGLGQIEALMNDPEILEPVIQPSSSFMDHVALIFNSLVITNIDQKADDMREELLPDHYNWLSFYLVKSRASKEHNLHSIFIEFIDKLRHPKLLDIITNMTYDCLNVLLKYVDQAKESSSYRTVLKNLGLWLGRITLARNRPLRSKNMDVKSLLFEAYENGRLVAVLPLVCKIMEGVKSSKNFKPPNPWTTAVFMLLGEIHALPNIRTNLIFEVEVLFKNLSMNVADYHGRTDHLLKKKCPPIGSSDFTTKRPIPLLGGLLPSALQIQQQQAQYQQHIQQQQQQNAAAATAGGGAPTSQQSQGQQQQHPTSIVAFNNNPLGVALKWTESQQQQQQAAVGRGGPGGPPPPAGLLPFSHPSVFPPAGDTGGGGGATAPPPSRHQQLPLHGQQQSSSDGGGVGVAASRTTTSGQIINSQQTSADLGSGKLLLGRPTMTVLSAAGNAVALASHLTTGAGGVSSVAAAAGVGGPHAHGNSSTAAAAAAASLMNDVGAVAAATASSQSQHPPPLPPSPSPVGDSPSIISGRRSVLPLGAMTTGAASTSGEGRHLPLPPTTATPSSLHPQSEIMRNDPLSSDASLVNTFPPIGLLQHYQQQQANINAAAGGSANAAMYGAVSAQRAGLPHPSSLQPPPHPVPPLSGAVVCGSSSSSTNSASSSSLAASSSPPSSSPPGGGGGTSSGSSSSSGPERVVLTQADQMLQNLTNSVVISPSIALFQIQPNLRPVVPLAVDRAIREIISAVVERSVTISCVTTRELVGKDFSMESDDSLVKRAAHLMVASLAGSLALVTCREPLRVSLTQHLRQLLQPASSKDCNDQVLIEQVVQIISADNLELGCTLIEQAVVEKALRDIEETMATGIIMRKRAREQGIRFVDHSVVNLHAKWPLHLPTPLKLRSSLTNRQLQVYKDFMHLGPLKKMHSAASAGTAGGVGTAAAAGGGTHPSSSSASGTVVIATPTAVASSTATGGTAGMGSNSSTLMGGVGGGPMASSTSGDAGGVAVMSSSGVPTSQLQRQAAGTSSAAGGRVPAAPQPPPPIMSAMNGGAGGSAAISSGQSGSGAGGAATPASGGGGMVEGQQLAARVLVARQQQQQQQQQQAVAVATASAVAAARQQQQQQHLQSHSLLSQQSLQLSESHVSSGSSSLAAAASSATSVAAAMARRANASSSGTAAANLLSVSTMMSMSTGGVSSSVSTMGGHHLHGQTAGFSGVQGGGVGGSSSSSTPLTTSTTATAATSSSLSREGSATTSTQKSGSGGASGATVVAADIPSLHALPVVQPNEPVAIPPVGDLPLSTVMAKLEECLAQLKEAVKDVINSMPIVPIPGTQTKGSRPLGAMAVAEDVLPTCSPSLSVLACLSSDHDLFTFARAFPAIVATAQRREECAEAIAEKLLRAIVDVSGACGRNGETAGNPPHPMRGVEPSGLYLEVYFGLLYSLVKQSSSLRKNMLEALRYSVATADLSKKFHVEVSSYFIRYDLLNLSDYDRHLVDLMDNGRCLNAVEFALSLMHKVLLDLRVASASQFTLTIEMLSTTSPSIFSPKLLSLSGWTPMPANEARLQLLEEVRQMLLNNDESSDLNNPQTGGGGVEGKRIRTFSGLVDINGQNSLVEVKCRRLPRPPIVSDQHRRLISNIFDEWVRLSFGHSKDKAHQHWAQFFQKVSHQGLLRMDENTDRFFYVCLEKAVTRASVLLQQQQQQRSRGVGAGGGGGKKKGGEMMTAAEDLKDEENDEDGHQRRGGGKGEDGKEDAGTTTTSDGRGGGGVVEGKRLDEVNGPNNFNVEGDGVTFSFSSLNDVEGVGKKCREGGGGERTGELSGVVVGVGDENSSSSHIDCVGEGIGGGEENEELISLRTPPEFLTRCLETSSLDALAKMIVAMMKLVDPTQISPVTILQKGLAVICRHIHYEAEVRGVTMNQRPYYRLLLCLLLEINSFDRTMESQNLPSLLAFANALALLNPTRVPSFSFAWLELISHRLFLPKLLKKVKGWAPFQRLLTQHFRFLHPFLRSVHLSDPIRALYKGTLRVLLVLLHDFPEFLCDYHFAFCDVLPLNCVQLRNLILSAFPRNMKLPDPFMPNLKVDLLPEIKSLPRILSHYTVNLLLSSLKQDIDVYWKTRNRIRLSEIKRKLLLSRHEALRCGTKYNIPLMNAVLLYVGVSLPGKIPGVNQQQVEIGPSLDLLMYLANELDMEGRYLLMSAISNHLRYPNAHTHYFSCLLLWLFGESQEELVQEQITRVLLERLIVHRPHPWGLLITFIELIKNPRFNFWNCSFVHAAPEVEKLFQSVAQTCLGHQGAQVQQQQQCNISASQTTPHSANPHPSLSSTPPPNLPLPSSTPTVSSSTTATPPPPTLLPTGIKTAATPTVYQQQQVSSVSSVSSSSTVTTALPSSSTQQHQPPPHLLQRSTPPLSVVSLSSFSAAATSNSTEVVGGSGGYIDSSIDVCKSSDEVIGGMAGGAIISSSSSIATTPAQTTTSLPQSFNSGNSSSSSSSNSGWQLSLPTVTSSNHSGAVNVGGGGSTVIAATSAAFSKSSSPNVSSSGGGRSSGEEKRNIRLRTSVVGGLSKRSEVKG